MFQSAGVAVISRWTLRQPAIMTGQTAMANLQRLTLKAPVLKPRPKPDKAWRHGAIPRSTASKIEDPEAIGCLVGFNSDL